MGLPELLPDSGAGKIATREDLSPHHFYAAYVFDQAGTRLKDVGGLIIQAQHQGYPVRYWWLSDAGDLRDYSGPIK
jgi:hypothetical protein